MKPIETSLTTTSIGPPPGKKDEIGSLPGRWEETEHGQFFYAVYELSDEDRKAIANGYNIRLGVGWIGGFPPVSLGVTHEGSAHDNSGR